MHELRLFLRLLIVYGLPSLLCGCHSAPGIVEAPKSSVAIHRLHTAGFRVSSAPSPLGEYLYLASDAGRLQQVIDAHGHLSTSAFLQTRLNQYAINADGSPSTSATPFILRGKAPGVMVAATRRRSIYLAGEVGQHENIAQLHVRPDGRLSLLGSLTIKSEDPIGKMELDRHERYLRVRIDAACGKGRHLRYCPYSLWYCVSAGGKLGSVPLRQSPRDFFPRLLGRLAFSPGPEGTSVLVSRILVTGAIKPLPKQLLIDVAPTAVPVIAVAPNGRYLFVAFRDSSADPLTGESAWPICVYQVSKEGRLSAASLKATLPIPSPAMCIDPLGRFLYVVSTTTGMLYSFCILPDGQLRAVSSPLPVGHAQSLVVVRAPPG